MKICELREGFLTRERLPSYTWSKFKLIMDNIPTNLIERTKMKKIKVLQLYSFYCLNALTCCRPSELLRTTVGDIQLVKYNDINFAIITLKNLKYKRFFRKKLPNGEKVIIKRTKQDDQAIKRIPINLDNEENYFLIKPFLEYYALLVGHNDLQMFQGLNKWKAWYYFVKATSLNKAKVPRDGLNLYAIKHIAVQHLVVDKNMDQYTMEKIVGHRDSNSLRFYYNLQVKDVIKQIVDKGA
jgi:integrase